MTPSQRCSDITTLQLNSRKPLQCMLKHQIWTQICRQQEACNGRTHSLEIRRTAAWNADLAMHSVLPTTAHPSDSPRWLIWHKSLFWKQSPFMALWTLPKMLHGASDCQKFGCCIMDSLSICTIASLECATQRMLQNDLRHDTWSSRSLAGCAATSCNGASAASNT